LIETFSEYVETDSGIQKGYFRAHVLSDIRCGVKGDRFPDGVYMLFRDVMSGEKLTCGIRTIDLEAFTFARELLEETEIVKSAAM
jgi:hypothetical protein